MSAFCRDESAAFAIARLSTDAASLSRLAAFFCPSTLSTGIVFARARHASAKRKPTMNSPKESGNSVRMTKSLIVIKDTPVMERPRDRPSLSCRLGFGKRSPISAKMRWGILFDQRCSFLSITLTITDWSDLGLNVQRRAQHCDPRRNEEWLRTRGKLQRPAVLGIAAQLIRVCFVECTATCNLRLIMMPYGLPPICFCMQA